MQDEIRNILNRIVPNAYTVVKPRECLGSHYLAIHIAASDYLINSVSGQYPAHASLNLDLDTLELNTQVFGGSGGGNLYRNIRPHVLKEKYLCYAREKIPFRRPARNREAVLRAVERFAQNWKKILGNVLDEMPHSEHVNYRKAIS